MIELILASCLVINGETYCKSTVEQPSSSSREIIIEERQITVPIYVLKSSEMNDVRYENVVFDFQTPFEANNCAESMLYLLEGSIQGVDTKCALMVQAAFGEDFQPNTSLAENVFRLWAHRVRNVLKRSVVLPGGLTTRLQITTGLVTE